MSIVSINKGEGAEDLDPKRPEDFSALVKLHHRDLLVYGQALTRDAATARDIVQEAFIVAYEKIHTFDVTRDFATWMRGIVRNKWREWLRKNRKYDLSDNELARIDADMAAWQANRAAGRSPVFHALEDCMEQLPGSLKETVHAFYYEGRTGDEVSEVLGIAPAAVRKRLQRARTLLKQCLDRKLEPTDPSPENS